MKIKRKQKVKRSILVLVMCLINLLPTASCQKKDKSDLTQVSNTYTDEHQENNDLSSLAGASLLASIDSIYYMQKEISVYTPTKGETIRVIDILCNANGISTLLSISAIPDSFDPNKMDDRDYERVVLLLLDQNGMLLQEINLTDVIPEDFMSASILSLEADYSTKLVIHSFETESMQNNLLTVYQLNRNGVLSDVKMTIPSEDNGETGTSSFNNLFFDGKGHYFANGYEMEGQTTRGIVAVFDENGKELFRVHDEADNYQNNWNFDEIFFADGSEVYVVGRNMSVQSTFAQSIDVNAESLGSQIPIMDLFPSGFGSMQSGDGAVFTFDSKGVYGVDIQNQIRRTLLLWNDLNFAFANATFNGNILPDGRIFLTASPLSADTIKWYMLEPTNENPNENKKNIRIAGIQIENHTALNQAVMEFNQNSVGAKAEIIDYASNMTGQSAINEAIENLTLSIYSGDIADIYFNEDSISLPFRNIAARGLLTDLNSFFTSDPEFSKSEYYEKLFDAMETDGQLYFMFSSFSFSGFVGKKSVLQDRNGWTPEEFEDFISDLPSGMKALTSQGKNSMSDLPAYTASNFIDSINNQIYLDSPAFQNILMTAKKNMSDETSDFSEDLMMIQNEDAAMTYMSIANYNDIANLWNSIDETITFTGFPSAEAGGSVAEGMNFFAIASSSAVQKDAYEFIKILLSASVQDASMMDARSLPVRKSSMEKMFTSLLERTDSVNDYPANHPVSNEDIEEIRLILDGLDNIFYYDPDIINIVDEESQAFFADAKSVEETTLVMQERIRTLINERG